jgi:hypothetical protein
MYTLQTFLYLCNRFQVPEEGPTGNRVRIPDSSRCCKLLQRLQMSLFIPYKREDAGVRSESEDLPEIEDI